MIYDKESNFNIKKTSKLFVEPKEKLEFRRISKPTSEEYEVARKNDMPKLVKQLKYYDESYNRLKKLY